MPRIGQLRQSALPSPRPAVWDPGRELFTRSSGRGRRFPSARASRVCWVLTLHRRGLGITALLHNVEASQFAWIDNADGTALASQLTGALTPPEIAAAEETMAETSSQIIRVNDLEWTSMAPAIKAKALWSDPATKRRALLTRFEPGATLPTHRH